MSSLIYLQLLCSPYFLDLFISFLISYLIIHFSIFSGLRVPAFILQYLLPMGLDYACCSLRGSRIRSQARNNPHVGLQVSRIIFVAVYYKLRTKPNLADFYLVIWKKLNQGIDHYLKIGSNYCHILCRKRKR